MLVKNIYFLDSGCYLFHIFYKGEESEEGVVKDPSVIMARRMTGRASEISEADERSEGSYRACLAGASQPR